jgi:hypothetical protein
MFVTMTASTNIESNPDIQLQEIITLASGASQGPLSDAYRYLI